MELFPVPVEPTTTTQLPSLLLDDDSGTNFGQTLTWRVGGLKWVPSCVERSLLLLRTPELMSNERSTDQLSNSHSFLLSCSHSLQSKLTERRPSDFNILLLLSVFIPKRSLTQQAQVYETKKI